MDVTKRSRMISLRISEAEYDSLKRYSTDNGVRSLSELARFALSRLVAQDGLEPDGVDGRLSQLEARLRAVEAKVHGIGTAH